MRLSIAALPLVTVGLLSGAQGAAPAATPAPTCTPEPDRRAAAVRCSDGRSWTVRSAGLILPPVLRCTPAQQECCETGFRTLRDIQLRDLIRVAQGQAPVCHMLAGDILKEPPPTPRLDALPEIDDLSPAPAAPACPKGQQPARGLCHDVRALLQAARPPLADRNRVLVPEAGEIIDRLRDELDATGRCPRDALDIGVVMRIHLAAERRAPLLAGEPLDVTPLLARPRDPEGILADPGLPVTCGYNATYSQWRQTSFHCREQRLCFDQSHPDLMHSCVGFARQGSEPFFHQVINCRNIPACHEATGGPCTGVARLIALGQGVFLRVLLGPSGQPYYYGLVFSPPRPEAARQRAQAREARALLQEILRQMKDPRERASLQQMLGAALGQR